MKRLFYLLIIIVFSFPMYVKADNVINEIKVYNDHIEVTTDTYNIYSANYSEDLYKDYIEYKNNVLTIKEGTIAKKITCGIGSENVNFTITSNNKDIKLGLISRCTGTVKIKDVTTYSDNLEFKTWSQQANIEVTNSIIYNFKEIQNAHSAKIIDSKLYSDDGWIYTQKENGYYIDIKNSELSKIGLGETGNLTIINSFVDKDEKFETTDVLNNTIIKNSTFNTNYFNCSSESGSGDESIIENSTIKATGVLDSGNKTTIKNSTFNMSYLTGKAYLELIDSNITAISNLSFSKGLKAYNSTIIDNGYLNLGNNTLFDHSYVEVSGRYGYSTYNLLFTGERLDINSSYLITNNGGIRTRETYIDKSNIYMSRDDFDFTPYICESPGYNVHLGEGAIITDIYDDKLYHINDTNYAFYRDEEGAIAANTLMIKYIVDLEFQIEGGNWADGTNKKVSYKRYSWSTLNEEDIPTSLVKGLKGHWEKIPKAGDYIKGDTVYKFIIDPDDPIPEVTKTENKIIEKITENPKTGVFSLIPIFIVISIIGYAICSFINKKKIFKKM